MAEITLVLFDMDGVLVDVSRSYRRAIMETVFHFTGRTIGAGTVQRYKNRGGFNDDWALTHAIILDSGMNDSLLRVTEEFQRRYRGANWSGFICDEEPLLRTVTLKDLTGRGLVLGIVTGRPQAEAQWTLERFAWTGYFPLVVTKEQYGRRGKPDPFPLLHALGRLQAAGLDVQSDRSLYIGDMVDDMVAARRAGIWAVGCVPPYLDLETHGALLTERGAHVVVDSPNALPSVLDQLSGDEGERGA